MSICLTTYNRAGGLGKTIDSILGQEAGDFELLIQDDCSSDGTQDLCREYARQDARVSYARNENNLGMPGNLNAAIRRARGDLIANLHDGDIYRPDLLRKWRDALEGQKDAAFVWNQLEQLDETGRHVLFFKHPFGPRIAEMELTDYMLARFDSPVWGTVMARRSAYQTMGLFNPRYGFVSDIEMWMRLNTRYPVAYIAEPIISLGHRRNDRPNSKVNWSLEWALVEMHAETIDRIWFRDPVEVARQKLRLRRMRDRRWLFLAAAVARHRDMPRLQEALAIFRADDSLLLHTVGTLASPATSVASLILMTAEKLLR